MRVTAFLFVAVCLIHSGVGNPMLASRELSKRHGDEAMEHGSGKPLEHIDEAEILQHHDPDPISYYQYDYEGAEPELSSEELTYIRTDSRHGGLMVFHGLALTISYLMVLPIHILMSAHQHRLRWLSQTAFWALNLLGWGAGRAYRRSTPNLYQGSTHGKTGAILLLITAIITLFDLLPLLRPVKRELQDLNLPQYISRPKWMPKIPAWRFWALEKNTPSEETEYLPVTHSPEEVSPNEDISPIGWKEDLRDEIDMLNSRNHGAFHSRAPTLTSHPSPSVEITRDKSRLLHRHSLGSDLSTLHEDHLTAALKPVRVRSRIYVIAGLVRTVVERSLVLYGWGQVLSGLTIYWGFGRAQYINGILAHFIKGSIFWWFGIFTFARYLGAWRRWGWAWNVAPETPGFKPLSASSVESLLIFIYGFTQQFMERFGKHPGDPYTAKDIEHISIAVMFWGGGLVGLAVENPTVRRWLFGDDASDEGREERLSAPSKGGDKILESTPSKPRWTGVSNPLPAVVIGITGIAMSAHHQTYLFQIQIHSLWGYLLLGSGICRSLTCFFEWVRPTPKNPFLPGLPPTELIGSIFLGAGGFIFICSDEQITFWAMRTHRDDMMMFLNLAIAFTCVAYVWTTVVLLVAGRIRRRPALHI